MPHSSGGGSHSGGSHGGSHSSGGGSSSFGRSSSGRSSSATVRSSYFDGAYRYVRYNDGQANYVYSDSSILNKSVSRVLLILLILFYIPFFCVGIWLISKIFSFSSPLSTRYNDKAVILDTTNIFDNTEEDALISEISKFADTTGIPVCIMTCKNDSWTGHYNNLSAYAFDMYLDMYNDENHWLILYSDDGIDRQDNNQFSYWYFEGIQGDNTDKIITSSVAKNFNNNLTKYLFDKNNSTCKAFTLAFNKLNNKKLVGKITINPDGSVVEALLWNGFVIIHFLLMLHGFRSSTSKNKYKDYIKCPEANYSISDNEVRCEYCNGVYYRGTVIACPHCGAPIPDDYKTSKHRYDSKFSNESW